MKSKRSGAKLKRYPSDLTRTQWKRLKRLLPKAKRGGRPCSVDLRAVLNGIFYIARGGSAWRMMPKDLPPWSTCYDSFRKWHNDGTWSKVNDALRTQVRHRDKREKSPSMGIIDSQSVKTTERGGPHGKNAHKKVNGRKRHLVVDTLGMVVAAVVHSAGIQDRDGAKPVLKKLVGKFPRLKKILADGIYNGGIAEWAKELGGWILELVVRPEGQTKFEVLPWRWIVERTFAWLGRYRRNSRDYERYAESSAAMIRISSIHRMLRLLNPDLSKKPVPFKYRELQGKITG
jgi:putative transposase